MIMVGYGLTHPGSRKLKNIKILEIPNLKDYVHISHHDRVGRLSDSPGEQRGPKI